MGRRAFTLHRIMPSSPATADFLEPPQKQGELGRLGPYRVTGLLGRGGMGQVYRADDTRLKRTVALKVMNKRFAATPNARQRFIDEARSMAAVHHDNVATIFEVGQKDGTPFMAMELLQGETLEASMASGRRFSTDEVLSIARQVASGLVAAHEHGITHRDIKPANLWVQSPGERIKILDFGLALAGTGVDQLADVGSVVGTLGYLSPEQARNEPVDDRTDLYALGVVMFELMAGRLPLLAGNVPAHLIKIICHDPTPLIEVNRDVPPPVHELVMRLLSKEPGDRIETAAGLVGEIDHVAESTHQLQTNQLSIAVAPDAVSRPGESGRRAKSESRPRPSMRDWIAGGLAVGLVAVAAFWLWPSRAAERPLAGPVTAPPKSPPILVKTLSTIQLDGGVAGATEIPAGQSARFRVNLVNTATSPQDDPLSTHGSSDVLAKLVVFVQQGNRPRFSPRGASMRLSPKQMPRRGSARTFEPFFLTTAFAPGRYEVTVELQTPGGAVVRKASTTMSVRENLMEGDLLGFQIIRSNVGRGADTTIRKGSDEELGLLRGLQVQKHNDQLEYAVVRFDMRAGRPDADPAEIDRAVLVFTVASYSMTGNSEIYVYGVPETSDDATPPWSETGPDRLTWATSPVQDDPAVLPYLGQMEFDNSGEKLVNQADEVKLASAELDAFLRSSPTGTATIVLVRANWAETDTRFVSGEGNPEMAPGLAIRWNE